MCLPVYWFDSLFVFSACLNILPWRRVSASGGGPGWSSERPSLSPLSCFVIFTQSSVSGAQTRLDETMSNYDLLSQSRYYDLASYNYDSSRNYDLLSYNYNSSQNYAISNCIFFKCYFEKYMFLTRWTFRKDYFWQKKTRNMCRSVSVSAFTWAWEGSCPLHKQVLLISSWNSFLRWILCT